MGRLSSHKASSSGGRPIFKVHYRKLVDDYSGSKDTLSFTPPLPDHLSYCCCHCGHTQKLQAEELNSIVGNAFRMAYAAQLQRQPTFQDVIASQLHNKGSPAGENNNCAVDARINWTKQVTLGLHHPPSPLRDAGSEDDAPPLPPTMNVQLSGLSGAPLTGGGVKAPPPNTIPGLRSFHHHGGGGGGGGDADGRQRDAVMAASQNSTPSSDESNSPTELNSYKRLADKPPLIKRLAMGLTGGGGGGDEENCPLVGSENSPTTPGNRPLSGGYVNEAITDSETTRNSSNKPSSGEENNRDIQAKHIEIDNNRLSQGSTDQEFKSKRISQISSSSSGSCPPPADGSTHGSTPTPPPLPERTDSLNNRTEEGELRSAPWFQAGIPREITLEVLGQEPVGAFMVRESTSKPGCFALSLRVPRDFQPSGIAHYLIMRTNKGYKIKGFTKEFSTLTALITHHSVMPELLPCPLSLSRYNPSFVKSDSNRDFADIDSDPDYNTLADFRKMMADLNV